MSEGRNTIIDIFTKNQIDTREIEELYGDEGIERTKEILTENAPKLKTLQDNRVIQFISTQLKCDFGKALYLFYNQNELSEEIKEGLKCENEMLNEKNKLLKEELDKNNLLNTTLNESLIALKNNQILKYNSKNKRKPLMRYK